MKIKIQNKTKEENELKDNHKEEKIIAMLLVIIL